jgi:hypothetical protein
MYPPGVFAARTRAHGATASAASPVRATHPRGCARLTPLRDRSHILQNALPAISWVTLVATLTASYGEAFNQGLLPEVGPSAPPSEPVSMA